MPNLGLGLNINYGVSLKSFNTTYQAILANATTRGVIKPSANEQSLQNALVQSLIDAGVWSKLDAFYMFANNITDATGGFALINWKNPSSNYGTAATNLPSITPKNGFTGSAVGGSNQGINLNFLANSGVNFGSGSPSPVNGSFGVMLGTVQTNAQAPIMAALNATNKLRNISTGASQTVGGSSIGAATVIFSSNSFVHLNVTSTTMTVYRNGTGTNGTRSAWVADTQNFYVLRDSAGSYGTSQVKTAFIGGDLSSEAANFSTIINNYITALNAL